MLAYLLFEINASISATYDLLARNMLRTAACLCAVRGYGRLGCAGRWSVNNFGQLRS